VLTFACPDLASALNAVGLEPREPETWEDCLRLLQHRNTRALVVRLGAVDAARFPRPISAARSEAPLTEVFVWAPDGTVDDVRSALREGAADVVLGQRPQVLARSVRSTIDRQRFLPRMQSFNVARVRSSRFEGLVSRSRKMWELFETVVQVAPSGAGVLILGETGVGKELLARAVHRHSARPGRFVAVNCGAIPEGLVDSELFGHEEGTFTGATTSKPGLFRNADGGTLFLDEVANLPLSSQYSLLRALQENAVRPIGGEEEIPIDVRVIAATSVALDEDVERGLFREDLLYRLDVIRLVIPPLRERPEDVLHLLGYFQRRFGKQYGLDQFQVSEGFLEALLSYDWPGNVRELENLTERLVLTKHGKRLTARHFDRVNRPGRRRAPKDPDNALTRRPAVPAPPAPTEPDEPSIDLSRTLAGTLAPLVEEVERAYLVEALQQNRGSIQDTAEVAGISARTLLRKMQWHGLDKADFKTPRRQSSG
jgi:DNA-binding NtrC family response regulator